MKKITKIIIVLLISMISFVFSSNMALWYTTDLKIELLDLNSNAIDWKVIQVQYKSEQKKLLTHNGIIEFEIDVENNSEEQIIFIINWNYITSNSLWNETKKIVIIYDIEKEKINSLSWINGKIKNQEIITLTNYKVLIIFCFFTLISFTILFGWRLTYNLMYQDVDKLKD